MYQANIAGSRTAQPVDMKIKITPNKVKSGFPASYQILGKKDPTRPHQAKQSTAAESTNQLSTNHPAGVNPQPRTTKAKVNSASLNLFESVKSTKKVTPNHKIKTPAPTESSKVVQNEK